jgi:hypothetical protein
MKTILDGARQVLLDVADVLKHRNDVIVVGGWGPYLRNPTRHPGTLDVDLLFPAEHSKDAMLSIAEMFLKWRFSVNAKHSFQLLKEYRIGTKNYIFNIDFLHPILEKTLIAEFRDIINFDITIDGSRVKKLVSICMPYGDVLFFHGMSRMISVDGRFIRLLAPAGVVFSKLQSCIQANRPRDIFDVLLSCEEDPDLWVVLNTLSDADARVRSMIEEYKNNIIKKWDFFQQCLQQYSVLGTVENQKKLLGEK